MQPDESPFDARRIVSEYRDAREALLRLADEFGRRASEFELDVPKSTPEPSEADRHTLEVTCLGAFEVRVDGEALPLRSSGKSVGVLKYLATRPSQSAPREQLLEALWPESEARAASNRLRVAVHSLRRMVEPELVPNLVLHQDGLYRIDPSYDVYVDAFRFSALWERAERLELDGRTEEATDLYREAELLYRGDYLEEDLYEDWAQIRRESLRDVYLTLEYRLARLALDEGDHGACIERAAKIVERDSCNEEAYALLMRSHAARGNMARALRWYELCEQALDQELQTAPSTELRSLRQSIIDREDLAG